MWSFSCTRSPVITRGLGFRPSEQADRLPAPTCRTGRPTVDPYGDPACRRPRARHARRRPLGRPNISLRSPEPDSPRRTPALPPTSTETPHRWFDRRSAYAARMTPTDAAPWQRYGTGAPCPAPAPTAPATSRGIVQASPTTPPHNPAPAPLGSAAAPCRARALRGPPPSHEQTRGWRFGGMTPSRSRDLHCLFIVLWNPTLPVALTQSHGAYPPAVASQLHPVATDRFVNSTT